MIAKVSNLELGEFIHTIGDVHLYLNHLNQAKKQIKRKPYKQPILLLNEKKSLFDYQYGDFLLQNYKYHPHIKAKIAI